MMQNNIFFAIIFLFCFINFSESQKATNPVIFADVPDMSMIRVGDTYYMSSTTMHMCPGVPVMKSKDLTNWEIIGYAYDILEDIDETRLTNGKSDYGRGSWASCLRFHKGTYYLSTFSHTTGKTYIFKTKDIESGQWERFAFAPTLHDHSIFLDDDGKIYIIWGAGTLKIAELKEDFSGLKEGTVRILIENASAPAGDNIGLPAEGSQLFKVKDKYYLFNITWPRGGMRTVLIHRADNINGPWEGRIALQDRGIAQGGLIDMPDGRWFAYLFRDFGAVGRIPYLVPVTWQDDWPILGINGHVPDTLDLPFNKSIIPAIVSSDEFDRNEGELDLPLVWQWNHNPDNNLWSIKQRKGYLRLITGTVVDDFEKARNTLTQRTFGPKCSGAVKIDVSGMKEGDFAGLTLLQKQYGLIGVKYENGQKRIVMVINQNKVPEEIESVPLKQNIVYFKANCNFTNMVDTARFYYSLDNKAWKPIGNTLKMTYNLAHFMGYRFGLFNYATKITGGYVDFDWFRINQIF
ncbi:MAG: glycoside hydrolase family 43 protein [Bacteroidales bacterium]